MLRFAKQVLLAGLFTISLAGIASAQDAGGGSSCGDFQKMMAERKSLVDRLNSSSGKGKKLDAHLACNVFTKLNSQGGTIMKWLDTNKDWCQVPDEFVEGFKKDHVNVTNLRGQACKVAAQIDAARKNAQSGGGAPPAWGGGVHGQYQMPKGAL